MWCLYLIVGIIVLIILLGFVGMYNGLVGARNKVKNAWSQIDVQLNRRADLVPNLVETVKGYATHEKTVFKDVTEARSNVVNAQTVKESQVANDQLTGVLKSLFAVAENYPELKANTNFQDLQSQLAETEDKIAYSRQFYNDTVLMYNNKCEMFPSIIIANLFNFNKSEFIESEENSRSVRKVQF